MRPTIKILVGLLLLLSTACHAKVRYPDAQRGYSVHVEDEYGQPIQSFHHRGKTYVMGRYNARYRVRVSNGTHHRVEAVISVDGRDVLSGQIGDYKGQRGYIIDPHGSVLVEGFRKSTANVASFRFTNPSDSYSSRMGTPEHVGVIGVAIFPERIVRRKIQRRHYPVPSRAPTDGLAYEFDEVAPEPAGDVASANGMAKSRAPSRRRSVQNLGTRYGETRYSPTEYVRFVRRNRTRPQALLAVYYDNESGLASRGIITRPSLPVEPNPFPRQVRFAPPPP
jgi:hypothetical protein